MIDWEKLRRLRFDIGRNDFEDVVSLFLAEADAAIARLTNAKEPSEIVAELDFLKGAALSLGFVPLANLCKGGLARLTDTGTGVDFNAIGNTYKTCRGELQDKMVQVLGP